MRKALLTMVVAGAVCAAMCPAAAWATEPASTYDAPGQLHANVCADIRGSSLDLRYLDGAPTGFALPNTLSFADGSCATGQIRLDLHELLDSPAGPLVFHRGGNGYNDDQNVKYGQVAVSDLTTTLPAPVPAGGGRGDACLLADDHPYTVSVQSIPSPMKYKSPAMVSGGNNSGASYLHYGDPGADQGDRHDIHYSVLMWSFIDVSGGGHNRALLAPDQTVQLCDVQELRRDAWDRTGNVNGWVAARYVRTSIGGTPVYGWMVWKHEYYDDGLGVISHVHEDSTPAAANGPSQLASATPAPAAPAPPTPPSTGARAAAPPKPAVVADVTAPSVNGLRASPAAFAVGRVKTPVAARASAPQGTTFRFAVSEAAATELRVERPAPGRRVRGGGCGKPTRTASKGRPCTRYLKVMTLTRAAKAGANVVPFSGRVGRRTLLPGGYRIVATARDKAGNVTPAPPFARFRVVPAATR